MGQAAAILITLSFAAFLGLTLGGIVYEHNLRVTETGLNRQIEEGKDAGNRLIDQARESTSQEALRQWEIDTSKWQETIKNIKHDGRLDDVRSRVEASLTMVQNRLNQRYSLEAREKIDREAHARFLRFLDLRSQAQLHALGLILDPDDHRHKVRETAHQALLLYASDPDSTETDWTLADALPTALSKSEQNRIREGCYDLLLILSHEAEPAAGLRILDRAARLHPEPTAAYHLRRAACLARLNDIAGSDREEAQSRQRPPATAMDHFLIGRERFFRREFEEALGSLDTAVRLDPSQTAADLLMAICYYQLEPKRLSESRSSLRVCVRSHPELVGLYLLRALIYGEEGGQALARINPERPGEAPGLRKQADAAFGRGLQGRRGRLCQRAGAAPHGQRELRDLG